MRRYLFLVPAVVPVLLVTNLGTPSADASAIANSPAGAGYAFGGSAYGTFATVGGAVASGRSALVKLGCTSIAGVRHSNTVAGVDSSPLLKTGTVKTTTASRKSPVSNKSTATVQGLNLLDGVITGTALRAVSTTRHTASQGFTTSAAGTTFASLLIAGIPVTGTVDPNTRIDVPGVGYVVLNEQTEHVGRNSAFLTVNALHLVVTQGKVSGLDDVANVVVAHAVSRLSGPAAAAVQGFGYGTKVNAAGVVKSNPSFRVSLGCSGTNGRVKTNEGSGVDLPNVLVAGAIRNTAQGTVTADNASAETTATVADATVLDSLVQATTITADAHASSNGSSSTVSDAGSSFGTLVVRGFPEIGPDVAPNTHLRIAGLGTLWLHRVLSTNRSIEVRMVELVVRNPNNPQGLPRGADLRIAVARAATR